MANGVTSLRKIQLGAESTAGTAVAATTIWRGMGLLTDEREIKFVDEQIGVITPTTRAYIPKLGVTVNFDPVEATYQQLPYILEAGITKETPTQDGVGTDYIYAYNTSTTAIPDPRTYTIEGGDNQLVQETDYAWVESFKLSGNAGEGVMMEATWHGRDVTDTTFTSVSVPAIVTGDHITFGGSKLYIDPVSTFPATTEITSTLLSFELDVTTGLKGKWTNLGKDFDFVYFDGASWSATLKLVYEHNATADAQRDLYEAVTPRAIRLEFTGNAVGTPGTTYSNMQLFIDAVGVYTAFPPGDVDGNATVEAEMQIGYDATAAASLNFIVVNELSALP